MTIIKNANLVLETGIVYDGSIAIENGKIAAFGEARDITPDAGDEVIDAEGAYVGPGFVDIHVHGGDGHMFDTDPAETAAFFLAHGATTQLAVLYYDLSKEQYLAAIERIRTVMRADGAGRAIAGIYMEGPYMNPKYGASPEKNLWAGEIKSDDYIALVKAAGEDARVWAIAPEREGIAPFMAYAKEQNPNTVFAVGHSEATPAQVRALRHLGIGIMTHCMDATGRVSKWDGTRGAGPDEYCFTDSDMYAELLSDSAGIHVNSDLQRMLLKIKGTDRVILITDSFVSDLESPVDLRHITDLSFDEKGRLSGSKLTMEVACRNIMRHTDAGIAQAFKMASTNPAKAIGMYDSVGSVALGKRANLVFVSDRFDVRRVLLDGKSI